MKAVLIVVLGLALFWLVSRIARWLVRRELAGCAARAERSQRQSELEVVQRSITRTTPSQRSGVSAAATSSSSSSAETFTPSAWDVPAMSAVHAPSAPTGLEPTIIGGASGGWKPSGCSGSDYSGSSDSGASCSSSSGSD